MKYTEEYLQQEEAYTKAELEAFYINRNEENREAVLTKRNQFARLWNEKIVSEAPYHPGYEDVDFSPPFKISVQEEVDRAYQRGFEDGKVFGRYAGYQEAKGDGNNH